jgi:hypothetical protein
VNGNVQVSPYHNPVQKIPEQIATNDNLLGLHIFMAGIQILAE